MKIRKILKTSHHVPALQRCNIFLGISLKNKYFTTERIENYLEWSLQQTKLNILILVPDSLHAYNYEIRNNYAPQRALRVAKRNGNQLRRKIQKILSQFTVSQQERVRIITWDNIKTTSLYKHTLAHINYEFEHNANFRKDLINIVKETLPPSKQNIDQEKLLRLSQYVLEELPVLLKGIEYGGIFYRLHPYPYFSTLHVLIRRIINCGDYKRIRNKLRPFNTILVELR